MELPARRIRAHDTEPMRGGTVPYDKTNDLPESVRGALPPHAQEIYRSAFNNAWDEYADAGARRDRRLAGGDRP
jgi:hypothetical protein